MHQFWPSIRAIRSAFAVLLAAFLMMSSVLTVTSHAASSHDKSHFANLTTGGISAISIPKCDTGAASVASDQSVEHSRNNSQSGQIEADCSCICNPSARLGEGPAPFFAGFASRLAYYGKDASYTSVTGDIDYPPIIRALS